LPIYTYNDKVDKVHFAEPFSQIMRRSEFSCSLYFL